MFQKAKSNRMKPTVISNMKFAFGVCLGNFNEYYCPICSNKVNRSSLKENNSKCSCGQKIDLK